jgi:hypothetical protein
LANRRSFDASNQAMKGSQAALAFVGFAFALAASGCGAAGSAQQRADAKIEPVAEAVPVTGPVLHGNSVVWGTGSIEGGEPVEPIRIFGARPGGSPRLLHELPMARNRPESLGGLAGSPDAVAFDRGWDICFPPDYGSCGQSGADVRVGAQNRRFHVLEPTGRNCAAWGPDPDGTRVAFVESCAGPCPCGQLGIDDVNDSKPPRILARSWEGFEQVRLAGNYVAGSTWEEISVHDLETGRKITYRLPFPVPPHIGPQGVFVGDRFQFDLQADGKAVAVWGSGEETKTAWFSPEEPDAHALPLRTLFDSNTPAIAMRLAGDRIAFERKLGQAKSELVIADLGGKIEHIASFDRSHLRVGGFDFDGKRLTWASQMVVGSTKECDGPPEDKNRDCWPRPAGPTMIYMAWLG